MRILPDHRKCSAIELSAPQLEKLCYVAEEKFPRSVLGPDEEKHKSAINGARGRGSKAPVTILETEGNQIMTELTITGKSSDLGNI